MARRLRKVVRLEIDYVAVQSTRQRWRGDLAAPSFAVVPARTTVWTLSFADARISNPFPAWRAATCGEQRGLAEHGGVGRLESLPIGGRRQRGAGGNVRPEVQN
jgi:hypothetical protein